MKKNYKKHYVILLMISSVFAFGQQQETPKDSVYPYTFPIWGQKVVDRGINMPLPAGFNINYVNSLMNIKVVDFELWIGDNRSSDLNQFLAKNLNENTLNFTRAEAKTNGVNFRYDQTIFPFLNVYGLFSYVKGSTFVGLQPTWRDSTGDVALKLPYFTSEVSFDALAYGLGTTLSYGYKGYFLSMDGNWSWTSSDLLTRDVGVLTLSGRLGKNWQLPREQAIAFYVGFMYRNFIADGPNQGSVTLREALPGVEGKILTTVDNKITSNKVTIDEIKAIPSGDRTPEEKEKLRKAQLGNAVLVPLYDRLDSNSEMIWNSPINYMIEKELEQPYTFQFGFNFQLNKKLMVRGEYGINGAQHFLLTGIQMRFGY